MSGEGRIYYEHVKKRVQRAFETYDTLVRYTSNLTDSGDLTIAITLSRPSSVAVSCIAETLRSIQITSEEADALTQILRERTR